MLKVHEIEGSLGRSGGDNGIKMDTDASTFEAARQEFEAVEASYFFYEM